MILHSDHGSVYTSRAFNDLLPMLYHALYVESQNAVRTDLIRDVSTSTLGKLARLRAETYFLLFESRWTVLYFL